MKNYIQNGEVLDLIAPVGGVTSGSPVLIGTMLVVPQVSAAAGAVFAAVHCGVLKLDKATGGGTAITAGAKVWWDDAAKKITKTAGANKWAGHCAVAAADGDATVVVHLCGTSSEYGDEAGAAAAVAAAVATSNVGAGDAGKLVKLDGAGKIAGRVLETDGAKLDSLKKCTVNVAAGAENGTIALPAGWADGDLVLATLAAPPTNPVAVIQAGCFGGNVSVKLGGVNGGANGQPGGAGVNVTVVRVAGL